MKNRNNINYSTISNSHICYYTIVILFIKKTKNSNHLSVLWSTAIKLGFIMLLLIKLNFLKSYKTDFYFINI